MKSSEILEIYYSLFCAIVDDLRVRPKDMAEKLGVDRERAFTFDDLEPRTEHVREEDIEESCDYIKSV